MRFLSRRRKVLEDNVKRRQGSAPVRKLNDGEVVFRIPTEDINVLRVIYPELFHKDATVRLNAWKKFRHSPVAEKYLVTRTPKQVKATDKRIIVK